MRIGLLLIVSVLLGACLGWGVATLRINYPPWQGYLTGGPGDPNAVVAHQGEPTPQVAIDQVEYHFGTMDVKAQGSHRFEFRNQGQANLQLIAGPTSCGCTGVEAPNSPILPNQSGTVEVRWKSKDGVGPYEQSATVVTNDPAHPRVKLKITGRITAALQAVPAEITFAHLSASEATTTEVRVYAFRSANLRLEQPKFSDPATADKFSIETNPLSADELRQMAEAKYGLRVRITAKSGLPLGPIRQTIVFRTNLPEHPLLELPLEGIVTSDITVYGVGWDRDRQVLSLGAIDRHGLERSLTIITRGAQGKEVQFKLIRVEPALLEVKLESTATPGAVRRTEVKIRIPPQSRSVNYLGPDLDKMGQILIETTHPQARQLRLYVSFSIDES